MGSPIRRYLPPGYFLVSLWFTATPVIKYIAPQCSLGRFSSLLKKSTKIPFVVRDDEKVFRQEPFSTQEAKMVLISRNRSIVSPE